MTQKKLLQTLNNKAFKSPPVWFMRQAGRYLPEYQKLRTTCPNFLEFCYSPELAIEATLQPIKRFNFDAAILFSDILVIPDALGQQVSFKEGHGPVLEPIRSMKDLINVSHYRENNLLEPVMNTIRGVKQKLPEQTALIGFCGAPWTVAVYMVEGKSKTRHTEILSLVKKDSEILCRLIDVITDASIEYLIKQIDSGVDVIQIFDSWSGLLNEKEFSRYVVDPTKKIVNAVREKYKDFPIIGYPRLAGSFILQYVSETQVTAVGLDHTVPLQWAARELQTKCVVQGNLDNKILAEGGNILLENVSNILKTLNRGPFIFNLGHGVLPHTPVENVKLVVDYIRNWKEQ